MIFLEFIKKKKYLNNLIFRAKNRDFDQKLKIIFGAKIQNSKRKSMYKNHNTPLTFGFENSNSQFCYFF